MNDYTYDCQNKNHSGNAINLPDALFPDGEQICAGMNSEYCVECNIKVRLEYLRGGLRAERISYGELAELADMG